MKLTLPRIELVRAIAAVKAAAGGTAAMPILANLLLVATGGPKPALTLTGCDLELNLRVKIGAVVAEPGKTTLRAGLLHEIARNATGETITLHLVRNTLHIECGSAKFQLATASPEDFPPFPRLKDPIIFSLAQAGLHSMLARTVFATSKDEARPIFNGSLLQLNRTLNVAACDGRRLGLIEVPPPDADAPVKLDKFEIILPAKAVRELLRLLQTATPGTDDGAAIPAAIAVTKNLVQFTFGGPAGQDITLLTKLIEGAYPDYRKIIPPADAPVASIQRVDLLHAVELVALVADAVKLDFHKQHLLVSSARVTGDKKDSFGDASDNLLCAATRELTVKLSAEYLRDALTASAADEVQFYVAGGIAMLKSTAENWLAVIAAMNDKSPSLSAKTETKPETKK